MIHCLMWDVGALHWYRVHLEGPCKPNLKYILKLKLKFRNSNGARRKHKRQYYNLYLLLMYESLYCQLMKQNREVV